MSTLREIQQQFSNYLLSDDKTIFRYICDDGRLDKCTRLEIYKSAYHIRLKKCIETDHPELCQYLGDELFETLAWGYIKAHPSEYPSLRQFCDKIPHYLSTAAPFNDIPILAEIASLERYLLFSFDAADADIISVNELQLIAPEHWPALRIEFHPSVVLLESHWNSVEIWQALKQKKHPPDVRKNEDHDWLIWRDKDRLSKFQSISIDGLTLFRGFRNGKPFAEICQELLDYLPEDQISECAAGYLNTWINAGLVIRVAY